jgi:hypothetical protein
VVYETAVNGGKMRAKAITGYNIYGKKVTRKLSEHQSLSNFRCSTCNSLLVDYDLSEEYNLWCEICGTHGSSEKRNEIHEKVHIDYCKEMLKEAKHKVLYYTSLLATIQGKNKVRKFNGKIKMEEFK